MRITSSLAVVSGVACGLLLVVAACSSFSSPAASSPVSDGGDANVTPETSTDAPVHEDGPPAAFCLAHLGDPGLLYCNDLEPKSAATQPFGFMTADLSDAGSAVVTPDGKRLAVLRIAMDTQGGNTPDVDLTQAIGQPGARPAGLQLDFDLKILMNNLTSVTLADLHLAGVACEASFGLGAFDGNTLGGTRKRDVILLPYTSDQWHHVTVKLQPTPASTTGYMEMTTVDGTTLVDREANASEIGVSLLKCGTATLRIGIAEVGAGSGDLVAIAHYDNIIVHMLK